MINNNYANAYKEVLIIINNLIKEDYEKIPKEYIEFLESNCNNDYNFEYDKSKTFAEQNLLEDTKYILFGLFERFGATEKQKKKIKILKNRYYYKLEKQKREEYHPDKIFKKHNISVIDDKEDVSLIRCSKIKWYNKILRILKKFFSK